MLTLDYIKKSKEKNNNKFTIVVVEIVVEYSSFEVSEKLRKGQKWRKDY